MKNLLIAAGVGALLVVAQTAVSAAYNPLDRVGATVGNAAISTPAPAAKSMNPPAVAVTAPHAPLDMASGNSTFVSEDPSATPPVREARVTDRMSSNPGSYNLALTQASATFPHCDEIDAGVRTFKKASGKCDASEQPLWTSPTFVTALGVVAVAAVVVSDSGESD